MDITEIISNLGFPIACVIACGWFIYKLWTNQCNDKVLLYEELAKSREATQKAIDTIALYAEALETLDEVKNTLNEVKEIVSSK